MASISSIINEYGIWPDQTEQVSERLYKVSDGRNSYGLKKSRLTRQKLNEWEAIYHQAYAEQLSVILPVYLTGQSRLYTADEHAYYYLTPWIPDSGLTHGEIVRSTLEAIGDLHAKTKRPVSINVNSVKETFNEYRRINTEQRFALTRSVDAFEEKRFMSPFELQVCTHYRVLVRVFTELNNHIDRFLEELDSNPDWYASLCHRHLTLPHVRYYKNVSFINWEYAAYDHPVVDLSKLLHGMASFFDENPVQLVNLFPVYNRQNFLITSERHLLAIYLLDPSAYISLVHNYVTYPRQQTMLEQTQQLERLFRQLNVGLAWSDYLPEHTVAADTEAAEEGDR